MSHYDDEEIKSLDEKIRNNIAGWRNMSSEDKDIVRSEIIKVVEFLGNVDPKEFVANADVETLEKVKDIIALINTFQVTLFESTFSSSIEIMNALKEAGEKGDNEAQKAYEDIYATYKKINMPDEDQKN